MNKVLGILFFLLVIMITSKLGYAQDSLSNKTFLLPEFSVLEKLDKMLSKINTQEIDSQLIYYYNTENLSTLISKNSGVSIRSYGVTGISSVAMRGGNANHTAVLWNGFNIQDPLNGGFNFSSSTSNFVDDINIQYGGTSAAFGSGAVGGTIHLNNTAIFNRNVYGSVLHKSGSFGLQSSQLEAGFGNNNIASRVRIFGQIIKNNFEFINRTKINQPKEIYENAELKQIGFLHEFYYRPTTNQQLSSQFWFQNNFREVPPNISSEPNESVEEYQQDNWYRWALNWNKKGKIVNWEARNGVFYNQSKYVKTAIDLSSTNNSLRNISECLAFIKIKNQHQLTLGFNNNYTVGLSENFNNNPDLNTSALYFSPSFVFFKKLTINTSVRDEYYNNELKPLTYSLNTKYFFYKNLFITSSFSKNYRTPNFNDLFWSGGFSRGNINLEDEYGYSKDLGMGINSKSEKKNIQSFISFYQNNINNQIQWIPQGQFWTPKNIKEVETIGVEFSFKSSFQLSKKWKLASNFNYSYTDARTVEKSEEESKSILDKQLIYIPYYQANSFITISYQNTSLSIGNQYVGYQFTRPDNLDFIPSYFLTDLGLQKLITKKSLDILLFGRINNLFNIEYEVRQWYPMPKMNYEVGIKLSIN